METKSPGTKHVLVICTSGKDRSPALAAYLTDNYPQHTFSSAGINAYFCHKHGTNLLKQNDINEADILVFCEEIHEKLAFERYEFEHTQDIVLNCGHFFLGTPMAEDWLTKAHDKLRDVLE